MLKQIFSKIPKKASKPDSTDFGKADSAPAAVISTGTANRTNDGQNGFGRSSTLRRTSSSAVFPSGTASGIEPHLAFKDVPSSERMNLFISKLCLCCTTFDFNHPSKNSVEKEVKRQILLELVDFVASSGSVKFPEPAVAAMCRMCAINLFRAFPPNCRSTSHGGENEEDEPMFDPAWLHLHIVYDLLLKFVTSGCLDAKIAKKYIDHYFTLRLLDLFDSEDPRERDCLKTLMHRIYGKFMVHRPFIRKSISNIFYRFVFEIERHSGIAELLEIFGSIISGFALPLKEEHKIFLWRVLIPLHKPKSLGVYYQQLSYCIMQFIEKDEKLASTVIKGLLKYWPITNSQKEIMFVSEIEEILEAINMVDFQKVMVPLFWRIACCVNSYHFQVAERALFLWNNDHIVNLVAHNRQVILPIIFPALEKNAQSHWNQAVLNLSLNIRKMFSDMDDLLFLSCQAHYREEQATQTFEGEKRKEKWEHLENVASLKPVIGNTAVLVTPLTS